MIFKLAWRNIWRNRKRSLITIMSIMFAVFFAVSMRSLQLGTYDWMINSVVNSYTGYLEIHGYGFSDDQSLDNALEIDDLPEKLKDKVSHLQSVLPRIESFALVATEVKTKGSMVLGILPDKEEPMLQLKTKLTAGAMIEKNDRSVLITEGLSKSLSLQTGDTLVMLGQGYHGMSAAGKYPIRGILKFPSPTLNTIVIMPLALAQEFLSCDGLATTLVLNIDSRNDMESVKTAVFRELDPKLYEVKDWQEMLPELHQAIQADSAGGLIMVIILYMVISFGIFGTMLMTLNERLYEFGVLLSIGFDRVKLIFTTLVESILLAAIGGLTGILVSRPMAVYFNHNPVRLTGESARAMEKYGWEAVMASSTAWDIPLTHALIVIVITLAINLYAINYIMNIKPVAAMRT